MNPVFALLLPNDTGTAASSSIAAGSASGNQRDRQALADPAIDFEDSLRRLESLESVSAPLPTLDVPSSAEVLPDLTRDAALSEAGLAVETTPAQPPLPAAANAAASWYSTRRQVPPEGESGAASLDIAGRSYHQSLTRLDQQRLSLVGDRVPDGTSLGMPTEREPRGSNSVMMLAQAATSRGHAPLPAESSGSAISVQMPAAGGAAVETTPPNASGAAASTAVTSARMPRSAATMVSAWQGATSRAAPGAGENSVGPPTAAVTTVDPLEPELTRTVSPPLRDPERASVAPAVVVSREKSTAGPVTPFQLGNPERGPAAASWSPPSQLSPASVADSKTAADGAASPEGESIIRSTSRSRAMPTQSNARDEVLAAQQPLDAPADVDLKRILTEQTSAADSETAAAALAQRPQPRKGTDVLAASQPAPAILSHSASPDSGLAARDPALPLAEQTEPAIATTHAAEQDAQRSNRSLMSGQEMELSHPQGASGQGEIEAFGEAVAGESDRPAVSLRDSEFIAETNFSGSALADRAETGMRGTSTPRVDLSTLGASGAVAEAVIHSRVLRNERGDTQLEVQLDPPELGRVRIELIEQESRLRARIVVAQESTLLVMQNELPQLRQVLQDAGLNVSEFELSHQQDQSSNEHQQFDQQESGRRPFHAGVPQAPKHDPTPAARQDPEPSLVRRGRIDLTA